jgi:hypothetical protein
MALDIVDSEIFDVAHFWHVNPLDAEEWPITKFSRVQEFMFWRREMERQQYAAIDVDNKSSSPGRISDSKRASLEQYESKASGKK